VLDENHSLTNRNLLSGSGVPRATWMPTAGLICISVAWTITTSSIATGATGSLKISLRTRGRLFQPIFDRRGFCGHRWRWRFGFARQFTRGRNADF
jgi:hypothetical protein